MASKTPLDRACPIEETIKIFGGKWKASILYHMADGPCRFNELRRRLPAITQRMLTQQLRDLEKDGLVIRKHYPEIPPRVEYSISKLGKSLKPVYLAIEKWGNSYTKAVQKARRNSAL